MGIRKRKETQVQYKVTNMGHVLWIIMIFLHFRYRKNAIFALKYNANLSKDTCSIMLNKRNLKKEEKRLKAIVNEFVTDVEFRSDESEENCQGYPLGKQQFCSVS